MSETVSKRLAVTFNDGLPLGEHGTFTYDGRKWIAVPLVKWQRVTAAGDRMVTVLSRVRALLTRRITQIPEDATWIVPLLGEVNTDALVREKIEAQTS